MICTRWLFDIAALSEVRDLLEFHDWMLMFNDFKNAFVDVVREFFVNLKQLPNMCLGSTVFGSEISSSA